MSSEGCINSHCVGSHVTVEPNNDCSEEWEMENNLRCGGKCFPFVATRGIRDSQVITLKSQSDEKISPINKNPNKINK